MINFPRKTQFQLGSSPPANDASVFGSTAAGTTAYTDDILKQQCGLSGTTPTAQWAAGFLSALIGNGSPVNVDHAALFQMLVTQVAYILQKMGAFYDANTTYYTGDLCSYGSPPSQYQSLANSNIGNQPDTSPASWVLFSRTFVAPGTAKAWVVFDGTTGAIVGTPLNVSSVTRSSQGKYLVNFTTAMSDANYAWVGTAGSVNGGPTSPGDDDWVSGGTAAVRTTAQFSVAVFNGSSYEDAKRISVVVFGN